MEDNKNMTEQTQAEKDGNGTEAQGAETKESKRFTQDEVNGFVQSRVARMRAQIDKEIRAEYDQKQAELKEREMKLLVKEALSDRGMPKELADIITCVDETDITKKLDALQKIYGIPKEKEGLTGFIQVGAPGGSSQIERSTQDPVRHAMGLE